MSNLVDDMDEYDPLQTMDSAWDAETSSDAIVSSGNAVAKIDFDSVSFFFSGTCTVEDIARGKLHTMADKSVRILHATRKQDVVQAEDTASTNSRFKFTQKRKPERDPDARHDLITDVSLEFGGDANQVTKQPVEVGLTSIHGLSGQSYLDGCEHLSTLVCPEDYNERRMANIPMLPKVDVLEGTVKFISDHPGQTPDNLLASFNHPNPDSPYVILRAGKSPSALAFFYNADEQNKGAPLKKLGDDHMEMSVEDADFYLKVAEESMRANIPFGSVASEAFAIKVQLSNGENLLKYMSDSEKKKIVTYRGRVHINEYKRMNTSDGAVTFYSDQ